MNLIKYQHCNADSLYSNWSINNYTTMVIVVPSCGELLIVTMNEDSEALSKILFSPFPDWVSMADE